MLQVFEEDRQTVMQVGPHNRAKVASLFSVLECLKRRPIMTSTKASKMTGLSFPTVKRSLDLLEAMGILTTHGDKRGKTYVYRRYFDLLALDTEPL
jgi:Fe2+ or Zn2+ uptake regulation protein